MRIISGSLRGRKIISPKGMDIRPTSDRVKEAIFNVLGDISGKTVLDLYAGTGNLSFESLSRGCSSAVLVDKSKIAIQTILKNAEIIGVKDKIQIINTPVENALDKLKDKKYDLIFADPPYKTDVGMMAGVLNKIKDLSLLSKEGIMIFELSAKVDLDTSMEIIKEKKYGDTKVYLLRI